ncbi:hypothetical protein BDV10DRAFT_116373 [Aspergillus recurvatus]
MTPKPPGRRGHQHHHRTLHSRLPRAGQTYFRSKYVDWASFHRQFLSWRAGYGQGRNNTENLMVHRQQTISVKGSLQEKFARYSLPQWNAKLGIVPSPSRCNHGSEWIRVITVSKSRINECIRYNLAIHILAVNLLQLEVLAPFSNFCIPCPG